MNEMLKDFWRGFKIGAFAAGVLFMLCVLVSSAHCQTKVDTFAKAIARTEGFYVKGTIPNRLHNPGDLTTTLPHAYPGQIGTYRGYARFKTDAYGWAALESQIQRIIDGTSHHFDQAMTIIDIGRVYAEGSRYWVRTVCTILKISPSTTFQEYFGLAPRLRMTYGTTEGFPKQNSQYTAQMRLSEMLPSITGVRVMQYPRLSENSGNPAKTDSTTTRVLNNQRLQDASSGGKTYLGTSLDYESSSWSSPAQR